MFYAPSQLSPRTVQRSFCILSSRLVLYQSSPVLSTCGFVPAIFQYLRWPWKDFVVSYNSAVRDVCQRSVIVSPNHAQRC